jgi:hypothetical protein
VSSEETTVIDEARKAKKEANAAVYKRRQVVLSRYAFSFIQVLMMLSVMINSER